MECKDYSGDLPDEITPNDPEVFAQAWRQIFQDLEPDQYADVAMGEFLYGHYTNALQEFKMRVYYRTQECNAACERIKELRNDDDLADFEELFEQYSKLNPIREEDIHTFFQGVYKGCVAWQSDNFKNENLDELIADLSKEILSVLFDNYTVCQNFAKNFQRIVGRLERNRGYDSILFDDWTSPSGPDRTFIEAANTVERKKFAEEDRLVQKGVEALEAEDRAKAKRSLLAALNDENRKALKPVVRQEKNSEAYKGIPLEDVQEKTSVAVDENTLEARASEPEAESAVETATIASEHTLTTETGQTLSEDYESCPLKKEVFDRLLSDLTSMPEKSRDTSEQSSEKPCDDKMHHDEPPKQAQDIHLGREQVHEQKQEQSQDLDLESEQTQDQEGEREDQALLMNHSWSNLLPHEIQTNNIKNNLAQIAQYATKQSSAIDQYLALVLKLRLESKIERAQADKLLDALANMTRVLSEALVQQNKQTDPAVLKRAIQVFYDVSAPILHNNKAWLASILLTLVVGAAGAATGLGVSALITPQMLSVAPLLNTTVAGVELALAVNITLFTVLFAGVSAAICRHHFFARDISLKAVKNFAEREAKPLSISVKVK